VPARRIRTLGAGLRLSLKIYIIEVAYLGLTFHKTDKKGSNTKNRYEVHCAIKLMAILKIIHRWIAVVRF